MILLLLLCYYYYYYCYYYYYYYYYCTFFSYYFFLYIRCFLKNSKYSAVLYFKRKVNKLFLIIWTAIFTEGEASFTGKKITWSDSTIEALEKVLKFGLSQQ